MKKVYELIPINLPVRTEEYLEFEIYTDQAIDYLGLFNYQNDELTRLPITSYVIESNKIRIWPNQIELNQREELLIGAKSGDQLLYFECPDRQAYHLWESFFEFGLLLETSLYQYVFLNLGGKLAIQVGPKMEIDTNIIRIPYIGTMTKLNVSRKYFRFEFTIEFDPHRFSVDSNDIVPVLELVSDIEQNTISISNYRIMETAGTYIISGELELNEVPQKGNYSFAVRIKHNLETYILDIYRITQNLFYDIHPYSNDRFEYKQMDCEVFWFDREGVILRFNEGIAKGIKLPLFGEYSFDKKLSDSERKEWENRFTEFQKGWTNRSSLRKFS